MTWAESVQSFWFEDIDPLLWFRADQGFDTVVPDRFLATFEQLAAGFDLAAAVASPVQAVASTIVLDQFPRNMFRGTARAFATDHLALAVAGAAIAQDLDRGLDKNRRLFLYLPFEHSEAIAGQRHSVELFRELNDPELLRYAVAHHDIIERFGRFPHRNAILARPSTPEEIEFLKQPGSSF